MKFLLGLLAACLFSAAAMASELAPDVLVKNVTTEVLDTVRQDKDIQNGNSRKTLDLVETKILPHFNFQRMTLLAMGREGRQATPEQLKVLTDEFRNLLVRTYSKALTEFRNQEISFKPLKWAATDTDVKVRTEVKQSGGKPIALDYYLEKSPAGWKVYDVEVAGASLITNYRSSFGLEIQKNGVDGLIRSLQAKNKTGAAASPAK
jgi:phospholipid transport system substrate-binding protein